MLYSNPFAIASERKLDPVNSKRNWNSDKALFVSLLSDMGLKIWGEGEG